LKAGSYFALCPSEIICYWEPNNASWERRKQELQESLDRVYQLFQILDERSDQKSGTLSGGEQQMPAIGRALMASRNLNEAGFRGRTKYIPVNLPGMAPLLQHTASQD